MVNRNQPVGCKASTEVGNVHPWVMYAAGRKRRKMSQEREDLSAAKPERGRLRGTLWGRYNQARKKGFKRERPVGWGARADRWYGTSRTLNRKPMVNNVQPKYRNTRRETYAGDQYDASGRQRGTLILSMGPTRAINGTPVVDNMRSRQ